MCFIYRTVVLKMASTGSDYLIDGKDLYSLRVIDLKQELQKLNIAFKSNANKAQLQALIIEHLKDSAETEDKTSEDSTNEIQESVNDTNNVHLAEDVNQESVTDLSTEAGITSSLSFGDRNSIKLTIKLQPNDSPNRQLSPKKSPVKEMRSPVISPIRPEDDVKQVKETEIVCEKSSEKLSPVKDDIQKEVVPKSREKDDLKEEITSHVISQQDSVSEAPKQDVIDDSPQKLTKIIDESCDNEGLNIPQLSQTDSNDSSSTEKTDESHEETLEEEVNKKIVEEKDTNEEVVKKSEECIVTNPEKEKSIEEPVVTQLEDENNKEEKDIIKEKLVETEAKEKNEKEEEKNEKEEEKNEKEEEKNEKEEEKNEKVEENVEKEDVKIEKKKEKTEELPRPRRRRWGGSNASELQSNIRKGISSDQLKELVPDLETSNSNANAESVNTSKVSKSDTSIVVTSSLSHNQTTAETNEINTKRDIRVVRKSISVAEEGQIGVNETVKSSPQQNIEIRKKIVIENKPKIEEQSPKKREVSPARNAATEVLFIQNLVRPFTLLQLKDVLGKNGKIIEERFWIDRIKSKCYVTYENIDEAIATRQALHGTQWPTSNPKLLSVDFSTKEELDTYLVGETVVNRDLIKNNNENVNNNKYDIVIKNDENKPALQEKDSNNSESRPIREWDREKLVPKEDERRNRRRPISPVTRDRSQEKDVKRRRQETSKDGERRVADSTSGDQKAEVAQQEPESPAKLLDDLFKKTTATPSIYWLPLTEEQIVIRDALRADEEKKRNEERNTREEHMRQRQDERRPVDGFRNERMQRQISPVRRNFGRRSPPRRSPPRRSPPRRSPMARRSSPIRQRRSPPNRFSRSRSPAMRKKR
ncbi:apoptotic chromatin condensation inducer in the nucleus-like [Oppia nitens]|uniref:apoptotic chromatin condensation inducer in the nucleus-like n=1 Tax=Oppia nitens TaxID=1686743 RepID=UPI0023DB76FC|nr:apoptotic chromatin condensation inducer in the nucleus-like [Oppia nitens]